MIEHKEQCMRLTAIRFQLSRLLNVCFHFYPDAQMRISTLFPETVPFTLLLQELHRLPAFL